MFEGLDEVEWKSLDHAYGAASGMPRMLRAAASDDPETFDEALEELYSSIFHRGTVYSAPARPRRS